LSKEIFFSKFKNLIFKKLGDISTKQPEPQYFVEAEPYYDVSPATCAPEAPAALVLMVADPKAQALRAPAPPKLSGSFQLWHRNINLFLK
jgi:hypothetical protein